MIPWNERELASLDTEIRKLMLETYIEKQFCRASSTAQSWYYLSCTGMYAAARSKA
jgi:hypothetical protein